jgi:hypothetical protein
MFASYGVATKAINLSTYAKYIDNNHVSIKGKVYTVDELLAHIENEYSSGKIIDLSISGKPSEQDSILSLAAKIEKSPIYKGDGVAVFIVSW